MDPLKQLLQQTSQGNEAARTQLFASFTGFLVFGICHLRHFAPAPAGDGHLTVGRVVTGVVSRIFPDFQLFNPDALKVGCPEVGPELVRLALYATAHVTLACALAVYCFSRREL